MKFPLKLAIGSASALVFIIIIGFVVFPKFIKSQIKTMVSLKEGHDIRDMFLKVPFALDFKVYIFNVTNPMEIQAGKMPKLREMGPFCYEEWKTKVNVEDVEGDDTILYNPVDTFIHKVWPGCMTGEEEVTIPHPMILGAVNAVVRIKPGALTLVNKAIKSIYKNPPSIFLTVKAKDLLFDGVTINCGVSDFAGKAICTQLRAEPSLKQLNEEDLSFSLLGPKNGSEGKRIKAYRGIQDVHNLGRIVTYDGQPKMDVWPTTKCNLISGTDGTIFPPFLEKEEGLVSFAADLCRSLKARYEKKDKYDGIPVSSYTADLGDMSKNPDEKCYCYTPETCLKKGLMDLFKCAGVPIYVSLPHFYNCHPSYLRGVQGLTPNEKEHEIRILFESMSGGPVYAKKRLQFNMPLEPVAKVELFQNFTPTVLPMFWVEEGVELNNTWTKPLKTLFTIKKSVKIVSWLVLLSSFGGLGYAAFLFYKEQSLLTTPTKKVGPTNGKHISTVNGNMIDGQHENSAKSAMSQVDKY